MSSYIVQFTVVLLNKFAKSDLLSLLSAPPSAERLQGFEERGAGDDQLAAPGGQDRSSGAHAVRRHEEEAVCRHRSHRRLVGQCV